MSSDMHSVSKSPLLLHCTAADTVSAPERFGHDGSKQKRQEGQMFPFTSQFVLAEQIIPVVCAKMFFFFFLDVMTPLPLKLGTVRIKWNFVVPEVRKLNSRDAIITILNTNLWANCWAASTSKEPSNIQNRKHISQSCCEH